MKPVWDLLFALRAAGIALQAKQGRLSYQAPKGALTEALRAEIAARKEEILAYLMETERVSFPTGPIPQAHRDQPLPLSFAQRRLWFLDRFEEGESATYNIPSAVTLLGPLDRAALQEALQAVVRRHEILRTVFCDDDRQPVQVIRDELPPLSPIDLTNIPEVARHARLTELLTAAAHRPFDLTAGPLLRTDLYQLGEERHVLFLNVHHIVFDGWSFGVLLRELSQFYAALKAGRPATLPAPPAQYADYAVWQRGWLTGEVLQRQTDYWKKTLTGAPALLELPTDRPRPAVQRFRGGQVPFTIPAEVTGGLKRIDQQAGTTLFMSMLAAFTVLLSRWSGQEDIVIGTPVAGRRHPALESMIGFFVNMLALRTDLSGNLAFLELLARVRRATLSAYSHQDLPFEHLVEELQPDRSLSYSPIFQVALAFQNAPVAAAELAGLRMEPAEMGFSATKFDLMLTLSDAGDVIHGGLEYSADLFDKVTIRRMADHFTTLLAGIAADPHGRVLDLPLLSAAERRRALTEWNDRRPEPSADACLHRLFEVQAACTPDAVAVTGGEQGAELTYGALNARANRLARHLRGLGVGPETLIGLCVERSPDTIVGLLGILKAGGAYVPLDPKYPEEHLAFIAADAGLDILVVHGATESALADTALRRVSLDAVAAVPAEPSAELFGAAPESGVTPHNPAYVIYTSGSTGRPKGVIVEHRNVSQLFHGASALFDFSGRDVWTLFHSYTFDFSVWEIWGALLHGGRLVVVPFAVSRSPDLFSRLLIDQGVTVLNQTPSAFYGLTDEVLAGDDAPTLRYVVFGGEALEPRRLRGWFDRFGDDRPQMINMYGITETTVHVTFRRLTTRDCDSGASPIGRPLPHLSAYVCNPRLGLQPVGVPGELIVGGGGVARGYLNRPELTGERFVPDLFSGEEGAMLYRAGDLARWLPDGTLEYLGRIDRQVKLRGFRIEPGEIEAVLVARPAIRNAAVILREDQPGDKRLVAYLLPAEPTAADGEAAEALIEEASAAVAEALPPHMMPAAFVLLETLPLTANGKLDIRALEPPTTPHHRRPSHTAPESDIERRLCEIWQSVLQLERVGIDDSFFAIGGDSILSLKVVARARDAGLLLRVKDLFQAPTVRELARLVRSATATEASPPLPFAMISAAERARFGADIEDAYPLASLQAGMIFHTQLDETVALYQDVFGLHFKAPWDPACFRQALERVIVANATLRTGIRLDGGRPLQFIRRQIELPLVIDDLRDMTNEEQERWLDAWVEEERHRGFRWAEEPLFRVYVRLRSYESFEYGLSVHHALLDGWSIATFNSQLLTSYRALMAGENPQLPVPPPYRDFIALEQAAMASEEERRFWLETAAKMPAGILPHRSTHWEGVENRNRQQEINALYPRLTALAAELGVPFQHLLLAAHMKMLGGLSGQDEVVSCVAFNGRPEQSGSEGTLGLFLNSLPLGLRLQDGSWRDLIGQVTRTANLATQHRFYPLAAIQRDTGWHFSEVLFNYVHFHAYRTVGDAGGIELLQQRYHAETHFPLTVNFSRSPLGDGLSITFSYNPAYLPEELADKVMDGYVRILTAIAEAPEARHQEFQLLDGRERRRIVEEWNATATDYPRDGTVHGLFSEQAARRPAAVAVSYGGRNLTFGELEARANRLAHRLRALGVGPESAVGLCIERSPEMIVGLLGILKAGGACVPLEPDFPDQRLTFMIADAAVAVALVHGSTRERLPAALDSGPLRLLDIGDSSLDAELATVPATLSGSDAGPLTLAGVMYTSGSTGTPKGVAVLHRNIVRLVRNTDYARFGPDEVQLQLAPLAFDASTFEIWGALLNGGRLAIAPPGRLSLDEIATLLQDEGVTTLWLTAGLFHLMVDRRLDALGGLRQLLAGGDVLSPAHVRRVRQALPDLRVINGYGPTENVTFSCCHTVGTVPEGALSVPIGRPIANSTAYILDGHGRPVPVGGAGELHVGGDGVARGYLNRPELTAERFIADPFSTAPDARLYRTGDLCRWLEDGTIEFLGRRDDQVKIRGFRIELGEIEAALGEHPSVHNATVVVRSTAADKRLVAYVVGDIEPAGLRDYLKHHLPEHMVPSHVVPMRELPLTASGKIDRRALPEPEEANSRTPYAAPLDAIELRLIGIWERLFGTSPIGRHDDFFDLGGHSLLAVQLIGTGREAFHVALPLSALFESRTVAALAERLRRVVEPQPTPVLVTIQPHGRRPPLFCIHPAGGTAFCYSALVSHLGQDQPVYGLQAVGSDGVAEPLTTLEAMAARYIAEIRAVQPHGPYRLCGWSFGGIIAFEMARQLYEQGEGSSPLLLLDSIAPAQFVQQSLDLIGFVQAMSVVWGVTVPQTILDELAALDPTLRIPRFIDAARTIADLPTGFDPLQITGLWRVYTATMAAGALYDPDPWPATIRLLQAEDRDTPQPAPLTRGWEPLAEAVEVVGVPGRHAEMLNEPCLSSVAGHLITWLAELETVANKPAPTLKYPHEPTLGNQSSTSTS